MRINRLGVIITFIIVLALLIVGVIASIMGDIISNNKRKQADTQDEAAVEISFVYAYQNRQWAEAVSESVEAFEAENPDVEIECLVQYESRVYEDALTRLYARNELGDIMQFKTPYYFAECGALGEIPEDVYGNLVDASYIYNDTVFGVSALATTCGVLYNKTIFEEYGLEEPETYEEFLTICKKLKKKGVTPLLYAGADLWHSEYLLNHFLHVYDGDATESFSAFKLLFDAGYVNEDWQIVEDGTTAYLMAQGKAAMIFTACSSVGELKEEESDFEFGWFYLPDENGDIVVTDTKDAYFCVTTECYRDEEKYDAAVRFLEFFYSEENYAKVLEKVYAISTTTQETDTLGDENYERIVDGYFANERRDSYIGDYTHVQGFERTILQDVHLFLTGEMDLERIVEDYKGGENTNATDALPELEEDESITEQTSEDYISGGDE